MDYVSKTQPQPPAFQGAPSVKVTVRATKPASAATSKASAKPAKVTAPTRVNAKGQPLTCMAGRPGKLQCSNPARWQHGKAWTFTTHHKAIERGKKIALR